jgi:S1-C subfamily serine protease
VGETIRNGVRALSLRSQEITPGFSGAPMYDTLTRRVVGLITSIAATDAHDRLAETAFAIPSEALVEAYPQLQIFALPGGQTQSRMEKTVERLLQERNLRS